MLTSDLGAAGDPERGRVTWLRTVTAGIHSLLPILEYVSFPILVDGVYDVTPDHQPILDSVSPNDGLWVAAGFSGHGFMLAPADRDDWCRVQSPANATRCSTIFPGSLRAKRACAETQIV